MSKLTPLFCKINKQKKKEIKRGKRRTHLRVMDRNAGGGNAQSNQKPDMEMGQGNEMGKPASEKGQKWVHRESRQEVTENKSRETGGGGRGRESDQDKE